MTVYEKSIIVLESLFARDCTFVLATAHDNTPSQRVVDTFYDGGAFWIVTHALSRKVRELRGNPRVSLCSSFHTFKGKAYCVGHPLREENEAIREKLMRAFEPWYFAHNDEGDENMCYVKVEPEEGFFHQDGTGYKVSFIAKKAEEMPFTPQIEIIH